MSRDNIVRVFYHDRLVGTLAETADKRIAFEYDDSWIEEGFTISPFSLPPASWQNIPLLFSARPPGKPADKYAGTFRNGAWQGRKRGSGQETDPAVRAQKG